VGCSAGTSSPWQPAVSWTHDDHDQRLPTGPPGNDFQMTIEPLD